MTEPNRAVFLSYASQDAAAALRICEALRAAGIEVWFDQSELRGGDAWDHKIRQQVRDCALFIPIISASTEGRREGYFRREWRLAVDRTHDMSDRAPFLVPVAIDSTRDNRADVPESFLKVQWTKLPDGVTPQSFPDRIAALLRGVEEPSRSQPTPRPAVEVTPPKASHQWMVATAGALVTVVIGWQAWRLLQPKAKVGTPAAVIAAVPEKSIAVLPFVDMSEKKDQEYFADGMAEEILNLLATIPDLRVIGRTSSFQFKGKTDDLRKIGTVLGAAYVVEGSVRRSGDHIRVTAQLIDTRNGARRWSETYDRDANDVLKLQGEIAGSLVRALQLEVSNPFVFQSRALLGNGEAYDSYLRGLHASDRSDQRGFEEAVAYFRRALALDPTFVLAAEALALNLAYLAEVHFVSPQTGYESSRAAAEAALKLDPKSALGHAILGFIHTEYDWDWPAAAREMDTAVSLAPNDPQVLILAATERLAGGPWLEGAHFLDAASAVDPLDPGVYSTSSLTYERLGRHAEAETAVRRALDISPTLGWGHHWLGVLLLVDGKPREALAEVQKETAASYQLGGLAVAYFALGRAKDSDVALSRLEKEHAGDSAMRIAEVYAYRHQRDQAFTWLERAYAQKDASLYYVKGDPLLNNLEGDPRYGAFLRKMKLPEL